MRMYDSATLWAWIYKDKERAIVLFEQMKTEIEARGLLTDFYTCFRLRIRNFQKDPALFHFKRANSLWEHFLKDSQV